ncbi:MAG: hypothetical protein KDD70_06920 [Bdellovibrionales bacterium]|nr:hypothetical protein [Bdellovibrionales bacterium]
MSRLFRNSSIQVFVSLLLFFVLPSCGFVGDLLPFGLGVGEHASPEYGEGASKSNPDQVRKTSSAWVEALVEELAGSSSVAGVGLVTDTPFQMVVPFCVGERLASGVRCDLLLGVGDSREIFVFSPHTLRGKSLGLFEEPFSHLSSRAEGGELVATYRNTVTVFSLPSLQKVKVLERVPADIQAVDTTVLDDVALLGGGDGRVYRWSWNEAIHPSEGKLGRSDLERYFAHNTVVSAVRYHPTGRVFFSGDWDGVIFAWKGYEQDPYGGAFDENIFGTGFFSDATTTVRIGGTAPAQVEKLLLSEKGLYLVAGYASGEIDLWKVRGLKKTVRVQHHRGSVVGLAVSPEATRVASYGRDQRLVVSDVLGTLNATLGVTEYEGKKVMEERIPGVRDLFFVEEDKLLLIREDGVAFKEIELEQEEE